MKRPLKAHWECNHSPEGNGNHTALHESTGEGGDRRLLPTDHTVTYSSRQQEALQGGQGSNQHKLCKTTKPFPLGTNI